MLRVSIVLVRVDQRLLHGQVAVGWAPRLDAEHILIADDALAADAFGREVILSAAPPDLTVEVTPVDDVPGRLPELEDDRTILLVRNPSMLLRLIEQGVAIPEVNVGGLHWREGARRFLDYVFVTADDVAAFRKLAAKGVHLVACDLPGNPKTDLNAALTDGRLEFDNLSAGRP
jgi:mannose/fructose/N-acetylgalactosamine-specific phosphotransferase system component IIB